MQKTYLVEKSAGEAVNLFFCRVTVSPLEQRFRGLNARLCAELRDWTRSGFQTSPGKKTLRCSDWSLPSVMNFKIRVCSDIFSERSLFSSDTKFQPKEGLFLWRYEGRLVDIQALMIWSIFIFIILFLLIWSRVKHLTLLWVSLTQNWCKTKKN